MVNHTIQMRKIIFPAEWYPQSGVQLTWPHPHSDWREIIDEVTQCYLSISKEILKRQKLLIVCHDEEHVRSLFTKSEEKNLLTAACLSNDTWVRDYGAISVFENNVPTLIDFGFNAWGLKFSAHYDNQIAEHLYINKTFQPRVAYSNQRRFILEGGAIETDGQGTLLTTSCCLLAPNRNQPMSKKQIEEQLCQSLGVERVLWLDYGHLEGDDTDGHIDTLARFCDARTIAYVSCDDESDAHFAELKKMEQQLQTFTDANGEPYRLVALPMADAVMENGERLPATYANFLIINDAVLLPFYNSKKDDVAKSLLQNLFPDREIVGVDCRALIRQHGSLHCISMQFPEGFL